MRANKSHGRPAQSSRLALAIIIPGLVALGSGLWMGVELNGDASEQREIDALHALARENSLFAESLKARIDVIRAQAARASRQPPQETVLDAGGPLLHWASIELTPGSAPVIKRSMRREDFGRLGAAALAIDKGRAEARYLTFLTEALRAPAFSETGVLAYPFRHDTHGRKEWLAFVFPEAGFDDGHGAMTAVLVDPADVFTSFQEYGKRDGSDERRAYLVTRDGNVVAHSKESYVGADLSLTSVYQKALRQVFDGGRADGAGRYHAVDQFPVLAAYSRLSDLPLALVIEEALTVQRAGAGLVGNPAGQKLLGRFFTAVGLLLFTGLLFGWLVDRRVRRAAAAVPAAAAPAEETQPQELSAETILAAVSEDEIPAAVGAPSPETPAPSQAETLSPTETPAEAPSEAYADEMVQAIRETVPAAAPTAPASGAVSALSEEMNVVRQFEIQSRLAKDDRAIPALLAEAARELSESPVIYFGYHGGIQAALAQAHAGFGPGDEPSSMSFPITSDAQLRAIQGAREGRIASMSRYEPLAKLVLARLGIAHFEAWALTSYTRAKQGSREPRLLGFLVIARAGSATAERREALARLIFSAGMILGERAERNLNAQAPRPSAAPGAHVTGPNA